MSLDIYNDFLLVKIENREYKRLCTEKIRNFIKVNIINQDDKKVIEKNTIKRKIKPKEYG